MVKTGFLSNSKNSIAWQLIYSFLTGFFGSLLIVVFLSGLMPLAETVRYLPYIFGFNGAVAGYTLIDRAGSRLRHRVASGAGLGFIIAIAACVLLNLLALRMTGVGMMEWVATLTFVVVAAVFAGLGAWLAAKYATLKGR